jgi:hypothetical protein
MMRFFFFGQKVPRRVLGVPLRIFFFFFLKACVNSRSEAEWRFDLLLVEDRGVKENDQIYMSEPYAFAGGSRAGPRSPLRDKPCFRVMDFYCKMKRELLIRRP